jgi:hypothetical protein
MSLVFLALWCVKNTYLYYKTIVKAKASFVLNTISRNDIQRPKEES